MARSVNMLSNIPMPFLRMIRCCRISLASSKPTRCLRRSLASAHHSHTGGDIRAYPSMILLTSVKPASSNPDLASPSSRLSSSEKEVVLKPDPAAFANVCNG